MKDNIALNLKGRVTFSFFSLGGKEKYSQTLNNAIQASAKDSLARNLIGDAQGFITAIKIYNGINLLATKTITIKTYDSSQTVSFGANFDPTDFSGDFTEARLTTGGNGDFSIVDNLVGSKADDEALLITWQIQLT